MIKTFSSSKNTSGGGSGGGGSSALDPYVTRTAYSLANSGVVSFATIFGSQSSGLYRIFDIIDPTIFLVIGLKHNGTGVDPDVLVDTVSSSVSITFNTASKLNFYISANLLTIQNLLGRTAQIRLYREI